jgi:hypothetical protein
MGAGIFSLHTPQAADTSVVTTTMHRQGLPNTAMRPWAATGLLCLLQGALLLLLLLCMLPRLQAH